MAKNVIGTAALIGAIGIILGAFGAHGLKNIVLDSQVATFEIGVRYQIYHALFLLVVGLCGLIGLFSDRVIKNVAILVIIGVLFFSGSIYLLTFKDLIDIKLSFIGPITPIGGVFLISAWLVVAFQAFKAKKIIK
ncbi:DUF423 domain-containing protein [Myroides sp. LJL115]